MIVANHIWSYMLFWFLLVKTNLWELLYVMTSSLQACFFSLMWWLIKVFLLWASVIHIYDAMLNSFSSGGEDGYVRLHHFDSDYFNIKI
jgi:hypothetical protein